MITGDIVVVRPSAPGVAPGTALPAGPAGVSTIAAITDATPQFKALNVADALTQRQVMGAASASDLIGVAQDTLAAIHGLTAADIGAAPASALATPAFQRFSVADGNATAGQTALTVARYTPGALLVFVNGSKLPTNAYTATNGTSVVLSDAIQATDTVEVLSWVMAGVQNAAPISHQHNVSDILGLLAFVTAAIDARLAAYPTALPSVPGKPWLNGGILQIS